MPVYIYFCEIHKEFEVQQSIKDNPLEICPQCVEEQYIKYHCKDCNENWSTNKNTYKSEKSLDKPNICRVCFSENTECSTLKPKKLISSTSFILSGGGWASSGYSK